MNPKISVVMSCYNEEDTVALAIDSILNQTEQDYEFIIVDDGSTDHTAAIVESYQQKDNRIRLIKNTTNLKLAASLNKGVAAAEGTYIARMDADDLCEPTRLALQLNFLEKNPRVDVLGTNVFYVQNQKGIGLSDLPLTNDTIYKNRYQKTVLIHPSVMFRKATFAQLGGYDPNMPWAEDKDLWLRWMGKATFANLEQPLLHYTMKRNISWKIFYYNHLVLAQNMLRRKELIWNSPLLLKSVLSHAFLSLRSLVK